MIERFHGDGGDRRLLDALKEQQAINGDADVAQELMRCCRLRELRAGDVLITQSGNDNSIFFILAGRVAVRINGREVAVRGAHTHVGEMALIEPSAPRSADVRALDDVVVAEVTDNDFIQTADRFPRVWRRLAVELGNRLRERSRFFKQPNARPCLFVGSSAESVAVAREVQAAFDHDDIRVEVWTDDIFQASATSIEALERQLSVSDFALLVVTADDITRSRGSEVPSPRDNVVFELGLCMGGIRRERTFLLRPRGVNLKIPSDLLGITALEYAPKDDEELLSSLGPAMTRLRTRIAKLGPK